MIATAGPRRPGPPRPGEKPYLITITRNNASTGNEALHWVVQGQGFFAVHVMMGDTGEPGGQGPMRC